MRLINTLPLVLLLSATACTINVNSPGTDEPNNTIGPPIGGGTGPTIDPNYAGQQYVGLNGTSALPAAGVGFGSPSSPYSSGYQPQIAMYAYPGLNDIAASTLDNNGNPIILYNPAAMSQVDQNYGQFVIAHEYGHIALGHVYQFGQVTDPGTRQQMELQADCWATQALGGANSYAVQAAYQTFASQGNNQFDAYHPPGAVRAQNIAYCAGQGGGYGGYYGGY